MAEGDDIPIYVIDNGSFMTRVGCSYNYNPTSIFPTQIGRPKYKTEKNEKDIFIGDDCQLKRGLLSINNPIEKGIITNWDDMEILWRYSINNELRIDPENHPFLLTETSFNPKINREKSTEIMFEKFKTYVFYIANQSTLSFYSSAFYSKSSTGIILDCGYERSHIVPIYEGFPIQHNIQSIDFGGKELTDYLMKLLIEKGYYIDTEIERNTIRNIKEQLCFISQDYQNEIPKNETYQLPDGQTVNIDKERIQCPEAFFQPSLIDNDCEGIDRLIHKTIMKCDEDIHNDLFKNIVLSGGSSLFPGMKERIENEMKKLTSNETNIKVIAPPERKHSAWIGGSILGNLSIFQTM